MLSKHIRASTAAALTLVAGACLAFGLNCSIDNTSLTFTGKTKSEFGKLLKEYRCVRGHTYWIAD